ncbi:YggT family protein [Bifidobacterium apri]|uniref:Hemolysin n=1 Tax=Bifidobacterium apri TaxID=1769423 RepID=A0A6A2VAW0_9BIFI|nr:hemolysin [Bifidobacterium apri]
MLAYLAIFVINLLLDAYIAVLFIRMILDWVFMLAPQWHPGRIAIDLIDLVYDLTEPPLRWLRRYIPPLLLGPIAIDLSFIVLYVALGVLRALI